MLRYYSKTMLLGLLLFGFIIGTAFSAYHKEYSNRELSWNIILAIVASIQGKLLMGLVLLDDLPIAPQVVLGVWVILILSLKHLFLRQKQIKYLGRN